MNLIDKYKEIWTSLSDVSYLKNEDEYISYEIRIFNYFSLFVFFISSVFSIYHFIEKEYISCLSSVFLSLFTILSPLLNKKGYHQLTRLVICLNYYIETLIIHFFYNTDTLSSNTHYVLIIINLVPALFFFHIHFEKKTIAALLIINLSFLFLSPFFNHNTQEIVPIAVLWIIIVIGFCFQKYWAFRYINKITIKAELNKTLLEQVTKQKAKIEQEATEIDALNNNLENLVNERTIELKNQYEKLTHYAFLHTHILKIPIYQIKEAINNLDKVVENKNDLTTIQNALNDISAITSDIDDTIHSIK